VAHHRLFVALHPPAEVRAALIAAMGGIAGARWQSDEQLHCTLRFLGELDRHAAEDVAQALLALSHPAVEAHLDGFGSFEDRGRVTSLWAGLTPAEPLRALHAKVDRLLVAAGLAPDTRAYRPHITIARFARGAAPPADVARHLPPPPRLAVRFEEVRLYESLLGRDGARYKTVLRCPLGR
jgi:RNA 2',3'-cyclic 3'-phosphodiesterase